MNAWFSLCTLVKCFAVVVLSFSSWFFECPSLFARVPLAHLVNSLFGSPRFWALVPGVLTIVRLAARLGRLGRRGRHGRHGRSSRTFVCQSFEPCLERSPPQRESDFHPRHPSLGLMLWLSVREGLKRNHQSNEKAQAWFHSYQVHGGIFRSQIGHTILNFSVCVKTRAATTSRHTESGSNTTRILRRGNCFLSKRTIF